MKLICGDAIESLKTIDDNSVNLICADLPYGTTQNSWDVIIPFDQMWEQFERVLKEDGNVVLTSCQPFTSKLIMSNIDWFKYDIIWNKSIGSGQLSINKRPLRTHEEILVFYKKFGTYNEQLGSGTPYNITRQARGKSNYGEQKKTTLTNTGTRRAKSVIDIKNPRISNGHPTQKPVELMDYIVKTYSNPSDVVLDCCMGSGTTGESAILNNRDFIGIEMNSDYFTFAESRLKKINNRIRKLDISE